MATHDVSTHQHSKLILVRMFKRGVPFDPPLWIENTIHFRTQFAVSINSDPHNFQLVQGDTSKVGAGFFDDRSFYFAELDTDQPDAPKADFRFLETKTRFDSPNITECVDLLPTIESQPKIATRFHGIESGSLASQGGFWFLEIGVGGERYTLQRLSANQWIPVSHKSVLNQDNDLEDMRFAQ